MNWQYIINQSIVETSTGEELGHFDLQCSCQESQCNVSNPEGNPSIPPRFAQTEPVSLVGSSTQVYLYGKQAEESGPSLVNKITDTY